MAKVIKRFRERYHEMKLYEVGDEYPDDNSERVTYLTKQGFLAQDEPAKPNRGKKGADSDGDPDA